MDNVKYYNDSLAYDFEMFMPKKAKEQKAEDNIVKMPKVASRRNSKSKAHGLSLSVSLLLCGALVLFAFCGNIVLRLRINEVNEEINEVKASIAELDSEKTSLEVEMQRRISYSNLELEAVELGMKKPGKNDVKYIRVNDKNAAKTADGTFVSE